MFGDVAKGDLGVGCLGCPEPVMQIVSVVRIFGDRTSDHRPPGIRRVYGNRLFCYIFTG